MTKKQVLDILKQTIDREYEDTSPDIIDSWKQGVWQAILLVERIDSLNNDDDTNKENLSLYY